MMMKWLIPYCTCVLYSEGLPNIIVEPLNKGHFGAGHVVEVVLYSEA